MGGKTPCADWAQIFGEEDIRDVITCFKFGDDRFKGLALAEGQILPFPVDSGGRPYNTFTLPCERVNGFRDISPKTSCVYRHNAESSLRMRDITWCVSPM